MLCLLLSWKLAFREGESTSFPFKEHINLLFGTKQSALKIYIQAMWTLKIILRNTYVYTNTCVHIWIWMNKYTKILKQIREKLYVRNWRQMKKKNIITKLKPRKLKKNNGMLTFKFQKSIFRLECLQSLGTYYYWDKRHVRWWSNKEETQHNDIEGKRELVQKY